jgi:hypothetical protein
MTNQIALLIIGGILAWLSIISSKMFRERFKNNEPLIQDKIDEQLSLMVAGAALASVVLLIGAFGIINIPLIK